MFYAFGLGTTDLCNQSKDKTGFTKVTGTVSALKGRLHTSTKGIVSDGFSMQLKGDKKKPNDGKFMVKSISDNKCTAGVLLR